MSQKLRPDSPETDIHKLRANALADLTASYEGLIILYDRPIEKIQRATTYQTKTELVNALMGHISAASNFAIRINLLRGNEVKALYEKYRAQRPDIIQ